MPYREFFTSAVPIGRDLPFYFLPLKAQLAEALRSGEVPWIDRYRWGGTPLLAAPGVAAFHPANLLFLLLPLGTAAKAFTLLNLLAGLLGFAALARRLGLSPWGSAAAGLAFALSGPSVSLAPFFPSLAALAMLPWIAAYVLDLRRSPGPRPLIGAAVAIALLGLSVLPEPCLHAVLIAALLYLGPGRYLGAQGVPWSRGALAGAAAGLLGLGLAMPALLPAAAAARESIRGPGGGTTASFAAVRALPVVRLPEVLMDGVTADWTAVGAAPGIPDYPYLPSLTPGRVALLLALVGLGAGGPGRVRALLLAAFGLAMAVGPATPVFPVALRAVPFLASLRYPEKYAVLTVFGLLWLAALGLLAAERRLGDRGRALLAAGLGLAILVDRERIARGLSPTAPAEVLTIPPPLIFSLPLAEGDAPPPRLFHHDRYAPVPAYDVRDLPRSNLVARATLSPGFGSLFGAGYMLEHDYDLSLPRSVYEWTRLMQATTAAGSPFTNRIVRAVGVTAVLKSEHVPGQPFAPEVRPVPSALPPFRFAGRVLYDPAPRRLWERMLREWFDADTAYVPAPRPPSALPLGRGRVISISDRPSRLSLTVEVPAGSDGLLMLYRLKESVEEARLDGRAARVLPLAFGFAGLRVPPGRHLVELRPTTLWVKIGLAACTASLLALVLLARRARPSTPSPAAPRA